MGIDSIPVTSVDPAASASSKSTAFIRLLAADYFGIFRVEYVAADGGDIMLVISPLSAKQQFSDVVAFLGRHTLLELR